MQRLKNWFITKLLASDKLVAVPQSWQTDYVKLAGEKVANHRAMATLITEYNGLLKDYYMKCSMKDLHQELKDNNIKFTTNMSKDQLAELAYQEFRMTVEKD